jgi:hypothetical protein
MIGRDQSQAEVVSMCYSKRFSREERDERFEEEVRFLLDRERGRSEPTTPVVEREPRERPVAEPEPKRVPAANS